jgi:hypothetical protein
VSVNLPRVGLLEACHDRDLFAVELYPAQRALLEAVDRGPRIHVWSLGRRSGKTTLAAIVALWDCLLRPELAGFVRPGERRHAVAIATNLRQARLFVRAALSIVERSPLLAELVESVNEDEIVFANGTALTGFPCSSRGGRGWAISTLVFDEFSHFLSETDGPQVADRVFEALVPSSAQFGTLARIIVASTPYGNNNLFADLHQRAHSGELEDAVAFHAPTAAMNPTIPVTFLEQERARDPQGFAQEYEAEFAAGGAAFLDPERIADAVADRDELSPRQATEWIAGIDPAFSRDPFALAIVGRDRSAHRLVLGLVRRWLPGRGRGQSFEERRQVEDATLAEVAEICRLYNAPVVTDQFAAPAVVNRLRAAGLSVRSVPMTASSKTAAFSELRARLNAGELELYEEPVLLAELRRLRTRYTAGQAGVVNPRSGESHGDEAQSVALAVWEHRSWRASGGQDFDPDDDDDGFLDRSGWGEPTSGQLRPGMSF